MKNRDADSYVDVAVSYDRLPWEQALQPPALSLSSTR